MLPTEKLLGEEWEGEGDVHMLDDMVHLHLLKALPLGGDVGTGASMSMLKMDSST